MILYDAELIVKHLLMVLRSSLLPADSNVYPSHLPDKFSICIILLVSEIIIASKAPGAKKNHSAANSDIIQIIPEK